MRVVASLKNDGYGLYCGNVFDVLKKHDSNSVHCVITSPPYFGLRNYGTKLIVWGGDSSCNHSWADDGFCKICNAWKGELGLEPTPSLYVEHLVKVFREVKRILREDGTLWLNLGDSYAGSVSRASSGGRAGYGTKREVVYNRISPGLKTKDLIGIPWRVAFALQADGWWLRSDCIWAKNNCMPSSIKDRPTVSHEYVFLLAKSSKYFYDSDAVREDNRDSYNGKRGTTKSRKKLQSSMRDFSSKDKMKQYATNGRNKRTVWNINIQPFPDAHFAVFPESLVVPCIKAGTSEKGCCPKCGAPLKRVKIKKNKKMTGEEWKLTCKCRGIKNTNPCIVVDPFCGSGTTGVVAKKLGRFFIGIDVLSEYVDMSDRRMKETEWGSYKEKPKLSQIAKLLTEIDGIGIKTAMAIDKYFNGKVGMIFRNPSLVKNIEGCGETTEDAIKKWVGLDI